MVLSNRRFPEVNQGVIGIEYINQYLHKADVTHDNLFADACNPCQTEIALFFWNVKSSYGLREFYRT